MKTNDYAQKLADAAASQVDDPRPLHNNAMVRIHQGGNHKEVNPHEKRRISCWESNNPVENLAMSLAFSSYPVIGALLAAEDALHLLPDWGGNQQQKEFMQAHYGPGHGDISKIPELKSRADKTVDPINQWLRENGFNIQLDSFSTSGGIAVASILKLLVQWLIPGDVVTIRDQYPGVRIPTKNSRATFFTASGHNDPIACLATQDTTNVYLTMSPPPATVLEMMDKIQQIRTRRQYNEDYGAIRFPMVDLRQQPDMSWLSGMTTFDNAGVQAFIDQALMEVLFKMNEKGARAEVAFTASVLRSRSIPAPYHIIDEPFRVRFERPDLALPLFGACITEED